MARQKISIWRKTPQMILSVLWVTTLTFPLGCSPREDLADTDLKVLNYFRSSTYKSLDPPKQFDSVSANIIANVYDSLLEYHYLKRPYELTPNLLEKMPELGEDKLTYTFKLRKGIMFHDDPCFPGGQGRELTSDDVIYTIKRFSDVNVNSRSYPALLQGRIKGLDAFREKSRHQKNLDYAKETVEGLKKLDSHTFQIVMSQPDPLTLMSLATEPLAIVPKEAVDKYGPELAHRPVGTGPFILAQNPRKGVMVLKKNPNYHGKYPSAGAVGDQSQGLLASAGQQLPLLDESRLPLMEEPQPRMLKFLKGEIDWIGFDRNNFSRMVEKNEQGFQLKDEYAQKFHLYWVESLSSSYITINLKDQVLGNNQALRQALAYVLDVPAFIDKMSNGRGNPLNTIFLNEMQADYVRTALAKGVSQRRVLLIHILKNAMIPILTFTIVAVPFLILGSFLMERFFSIPGLGDLMITAINNGDFPVLKGMTMYITITYAMFNLLTDLLIAAVDPRIKLH